jgi:hypothetical protein
MFFELHLATIAVDHRSGGSCKPLPLAPFSQQTLIDLRASRLEFEAEHQLYSAGLKSDALEAIQVTEAFHAFSSVVGSEESSTLLRLLDMGDETKCALTKKISEYAGVPSNLDLIDWTNLHSLLR